MELETVIGLEVHVQLATASKLFCGCSTRFGNPPNSQTCPVCLGLPGVLPVLNSRALEYAVKAACALNCRIAQSTKFDRKNYYYPDLPKNYQISQYDRPLAIDGWLDVEMDGQSRRIGIIRVHLEEDAGKLLHLENEPESAVDLNRTGIPLLEIVSRPDLRSPQEARVYLETLRRIMRYIGVSDCNMEEGSLRCDANISLRPAGSATLGTKTEIKNMNSFRHVEQALTFEADRQSRLLAAAGRIVQETRLFDAATGATRSMRSKEEAQDYRYFPEPDLPEFVLSPEWVAGVKAGVGELPLERKRRYQKEHGLSEYDAGVLTAEKEIADFFEAVVACGAPAKPACNWVTQDILRVLSERKAPLSALAITPRHIAQMIELVESGSINYSLGRNKVFPVMLADGRLPAEIVAAEGLAQVSDGSALEAACRLAIKENPKALEDYRKGKKGAEQFLFGQLMRQMKGRANPQAARQALRRALAEFEGGQPSRPGE